MGFSEDGRGRSDRFQRRREPGVDGHLQHDLEDLVGSAADVQRTADTVF